MNILGGAWEGQSKALSAQQSINVYIELGDDGQASLKGVHGTDLENNLSYDVRGLKNAWGKLYAVAGSNVYYIDSAGAATELGSIVNDGLPVSMAHNIAELAIVSGGRMWVVQKSTHVLSEVTDVDLPVVNKIDFLDGYGIVLERNSGRFHFTTIDDFETIDGADFATAEGAPDDLVSLIVDHRELWLFGEDTTEIWFNSGDATNPFQRQTILERGCKGLNSPAKLDNTVFWLGDNNVVYRADGYTPIRVSNHGIEYQIGQTTTDPVSFAYTWDGHDFYQLTFPGELTIVYDASIPDPNKAWHTRETYGRADCVYQHHAFAYGKHFAGGDKVYSLNSESYQHNGDELPRVRTIGPLRADRYSSMAELKFFMETGETSHLATEPKVFLEISDDGGRTFGNRIEAGIGKQGEYAGEVRFLGLGGFYDGQRVLRLSMTDNAMFSVVDARAA
jgi:hypothetical protein